MISNIARVIFYIVAGFFVYGVELLAFINLGPGKYLTTLGVCVVSAVVAILALVAGSAFDRFRHMIRDSGIVLLSVGGFVAVGVLSFAWLMGSEDFRKALGPQAVAALTDYVTGFSCLIALTLLGFILVIVGVRKSRPRSTSS